jgi:hypothetical protein
MIKNNYIYILWMQCAIFITFSIHQALGIDLVTNRNLLCIIYFQCLLFALLFDRERLFTTYLLMTFLFNLVMPILESLGLFVFPPNNLILLGDGITMPISSSSLSEAYASMIIMLVGATSGWCYSKILYREKIDKYTNDFSGIKDSEKLKKYAYILFFVFYVVVIYRNILLAYYANIYGYVDVMHSQKTDIGMPAIAVFADMFYKLTGFLLLYFIQSEKEFKRVCILFALPFLIQSIAGSRGEFVIVTITLVLIYQINYGSLKASKVLKWGIILFLFGVVLGIYRFSRDFNSLLELKILANAIMTVFLGNSASLGVLAYTIQLKDQFFNNIPFLMGYIDAIFSVAPNYTLEGLINKSYLAQHLTYILNHDKLFGGSTIGTAVVAEFYEIARGSYFILFILSFLMVYIGQLLVFNLRKNFIIFFFSALYFEALVLAPRGSIMKVFSKESLASYVIILIAYFFLKCANRTKVKLGDNLP